MWPMGISPPGRTTFQAFYGQGTGSTDNPRPWNKPAGASLVYILCIGGGGSGGSKNNASNDTTGAGGGACGGITATLYPAAVLPSTLFVRVSGVAVAPTGFGNGTNGGTSYVTITDRSAVDTSRTVCFANGGNGGNASSGVGGTAATVAGATGAAFFGYSVFFARGGVVGGAGASLANAGGSNITGWNFGTILTPGTGGGNGTGKGGDIDGSTTLGIPNAVGGAGTTGVRGLDGIGPQVIDFSSRTRLLFRGGNGGGGHSNGVSGNGGHGAIGCGGGGAGGSASGANTAIGGNGGPGLVLIAAW